MAEIQLQFLNFIQDHLRSPAGDWLAVHITKLGNGGMIWIILGIVLLFFRGHRKTGGLLLASLGVDYLFCNLFLKNLIAAPRPFQLNPAVSLLIPPPQDFSFPSGHTAVSFAAVTVLFLKKEKFRVPALILALLISFSRLYLYVHFPVDILGGAAAGAASAAVTVWAVRKIRGYYEKKRRAGT